jgi:hypothetical protein
VVLEDGSTQASVPNALDLVHVPVLEALQEAVDDETLQLVEDLAAGLWRRLLAETTASLHRAFR